MDYLQEAKTQFEIGLPSDEARYSVLFRMEAARTAALIAICERLDRLIAIFEPDEEPVVYMPISGMLTADKRIDGGEG